VPLLLPGLVQEDGKLKRKEIKTLKNVGIKSLLLDYPCTAVKC